MKKSDTYFHLWLKNKNIVEMSFYGLICGKILFVFNEEGFLDGNLSPLLYVLCLNMQKIIAVILELEFEIY